MTLKSFKKLSAVLLTSMLPFSAAQANSAFDCGYVGLGIGESLTTSRLSTASSARVDIDGTILTASNNSVQRMNKHTWFGDIYAGYGFSCCPFYYGAELSLKISNPDSENLTSTSFTSTEGGSSGLINESTRLHFSKFEVDLDARPGYLLSDCSLLYGRVGLALSRVALRTNLRATLQAADLVEGNDPFTTVQSPENKKTVLGLRLGFGMEQKFCDCFGLRLDYVYTRFRRLRTNVNVSRTFAADGATITASLTDNRKVNISNHSVMLGLSYYW